MSTDLQAKKILIKYTFTYLIIYQVDFFGVQWSLEDDSDQQGGNIFDTVY